MVVCLVVFAVVGSGLIAFGARLGPASFLVGVVPMSATAVWVSTQLPGIIDGGTVEEQFTWVAGLGLDVDLRLDGLSATMALIVSVVGVAVLVYSARYFPSDARDLGRLAGLLVLFGGSMLGLVLSDNVLLLYVFWELTSVMSFLLIGNRHEESRARAAALHALLVTTAGGLAMLGGLVVLGQEAGTYRLSGILANPPAPSTTLTVAIVAILAGAFTKSAQYPFHAWLPGAMAAPTPVSAYLHSATLVKAGIFLVAVLAPVFAELDVWRPLVLTVGCCSLVFGGLRALRQHDLKVLLAFGTVSQLGLLMVLFGAGTAQTATAGWELLVAHAMFKAALFMVVGILDHQTGTRDIRQLPALAAGWRGVEVTTLLVLASMAGIPLEMGFVAKELAYESLDGAGFAGHWVVLAVVVGGSMLTVAYAARFYWGAFVRPRRRHAARTGSPAKPPSVSLVAPAAFFAIASLMLGLFPGMVDGLATASLAGFGAGAPDVHLSLWHGFGVPLFLSAVTLAGGALLAVNDRRVQRFLVRGRAIPSGGELYLAALRGLGAMSTRVTAFVQNGSLPVYAGVILATAALAPAAALAGVAWEGWPPFGPIHEVPVALILLISAIGAAATRSRFSAAVFLSVAGYAMAGVFVLSGDPDLALTQTAVETLTTVVFVLVLRRLPQRFEPQSTTLRRAVRLVIAGVVAVTVFVFALVAAGSRITPPVSDEMVRRSVPDGHGKNVVNVILVDFRGFDTLGEVTVLAVASIGAVALARAGRRASRAGPVRAAAPTRPVRRLPFVDASVQVIFYVVFMLSLWLLFVGHNQPGGGFVGGLLAGSAITLRYVAGGISEVRARTRFRPWTVLGAGLLLAAVTAVLPLLLGHSVLEVGYATLELPLIGTVPLSSALAFDTGVYLVVVGVVLMAFEAFGDTPADVSDPAEVTV